MSTSKMFAKLSKWFIGGTILVLAMVSLFSANPAWAAPTMSNTGFESGALSPWTYWGAASVVASNAHSGSYAAQVGTATGAVEQTVTGLSASTTYVLAGWVKTSTTAVTGEIGVKNFGGTETYKTSTSTSYTQLSVQFTTGSGNTSATVFCYNTASNGYLYCDDFSVTQMANPGFESGALSPWTYWGTASVAASNAHSGTYSGQVGTATGAVEQTVYGLSPSTAYVLTGWVKTSATSVTVAIGAKEFGGTEVSQSSTSTSYTQLTVNFTTGASNTSVKIFCYKPTTSGYIYCDDFAVIKSGSAAPTSTPTPTPTNTPGMTLVWSDEFNSGSTPNTNDWVYEIGYMRNNELQYYTNRSNNAYISGGNLVIKAIQESYQGYNYTSASINTAGKHSWQYGRIEMRAQLPYGKGIWPAFWAMGNSGSWPACGEIDIMELVGGGEGYDDKIFGTIHWDNGGHQSSGSNAQLADGIYADGFHIFAVEWSSTQIKWYMDTWNYYTVDISGADKSELRQPFYVMLNLAVGGDWPGSPDGTTVLPQYYYIDYVRIYQ